MNSTGETMINLFYENFDEKTIPSDTPIMFNDICVGHTVGDNLLDKPVKVVLYPHAYDIMRLCETGDVCSLEIRKWDNIV